MVGAAGIEPVPLSNSESADTIQPGPDTKIKGLIS
ncbi:MAG: hypothetical protein UT80_C0048G0010 [Parcubacteria group bacterium GW2011_GWC1_40_13]|nr:MAG: hypothetical protein UT80_C0048G0010 [Parcubacteria group bacterium GW2011_GWC1_40_13]